MAIALPAHTTLAELAARFGGAVDAGAADLPVTAVAPVDRAEAGELAPFLSRKKPYLAAARHSSAALLVEQSLASLIPEGRRWVHPRASLALTRLLESVAPPLPPDARDRAHIDPGADVHPTAVVGPGAVILAGARVGPRARIEPNAVIYGGAVIGPRAVVGAGAVVGRPGFGWTMSEAGDLLRVPQLGGVLVEEDAEVGPLATIDAGTLAPTVIGRGVKLDAQVHVGHNGVIGAHTIVAAQAGFAGSVTVEPGVLVGGQAGVADHARIGAGAKLAAKSGVIGDIAPGAVVAGYPAVDRARWLRATARSLGASKKDERGGGDDEG